MSLLNQINTAQRVNFPLKSLVVATLTSFIFCSSAFTQERPEDFAFRQCTDSILKEADILYRYESAAWVATDMALQHEKIKNDFGGYLVYSSGDTVKVSVRSKNSGRRIYSLSFTTNVRKPVLEEFTDRDLTSNELNLWTIKQKITSNATSGNYGVSCPEGYNLNLQLLPSSTNYKLYIFTGTSQSNVIPFGNDYLFLADAKGNILTSHKFHSRLISLATRYNDNPVVSLVHSHLRTEPYISATDICTFRLYAPIYGLKTFSVLSTALGMYFEYNIDTNAITTKLMNND